MDYAIELVGGLPLMTFSKVSNISNNIYLSLKIKRGSFFVDPTFGSRLHLLKKNTPRTATLAEEYAKEALRWLIDTGRAVKIEVRAERDLTQDLSRLKLAIEVTQADGTALFFDDFVEVV